MKCHLPVVPELGETTFAQRVDAIGVEVPDFVAGDIEDSVIAQ